jgi:hypothetical protein
MMWARRIADVFVAPADEHDATTAREPRSRAPRGSDRRSRRAPRGARAGVDRSRSSGVERPAAAVAVLAPASDAPALGAALGMALARAGRAPVCVVCVWSPAPARSGWRAPPTPAAARLASTLRARGHDAGASGRLVLVALSTGEEEAASQALRVGAAAGSAPTVVVLGGPRAAAFDGLLAMQDLVVVAVASGSDASLARLASAGLERALTCALPPADPARALAAAGLVLLPSTRRALAAPVAALS